MDNNSQFLISSALGEDTHIKVWDFKGNLLQSVNTSTMSQRYSKYKLKN